MVNWCATGLIDWRLNSASERFFWGAMNMRRCFYMDTDDVCTCTRKIFHRWCSGFDTIVGQSKTILLWGQALDSTCTKTYLRYTKWLHDIDMGIFCPSCFSRLDFTFNVGIICCQNWRSNLVYWDIGFFILVFFCWLFYRFLYDFQYF